MRRDTAWTTNDGGVSIWSSVWLFFACSSSLAHSITILAGQGRVATREAAAKGMPKKTWLVALGRRKRSSTGRSSAGAGMQCRADAAL